MRLLRMTEGHGDIGFGQPCACCHIDFFQWELQLAPLTQKPNASHLQMSIIFAACRFRSSTLRFNSPEAQRTSAVYEGDSTRCHLDSMTWVRSQD